MSQTKKIITPYPHQTQALSAIFQSLEQGNHPVAALPTGSGKSLIAAWLAEELAKRNKVLIVTHRKELIQQNAKQLFSIGFRDFSIYSASLNSKSLHGQVVFAQIQSLFRIEHLPDFQFIIIDEAHLISRKDGSMYQRLFSMLPNAQRTGLSATPYRMDTGMLHEGDDAMFNDMCIHIKPQSLIPEYLCPLRGVGAESEMSAEGVHKRYGEFIEKELEQVVCTEENVQKTVREAVSLMGNHVLCFAVTINHAVMLRDQFKALGVACEMVTGNMKQERDWNIAKFKSGEIRVLVNVNVLTTGFDAPFIDTLLLMRHTMSRGLFEQMLGRGMRNATGKEFCRVLDFAGNILRHGAIGELESFDDRQKEEREKKEREKKEREEKRDKIYTQLDRYSDPLADEQVHELQVRALYYFTKPASKQRGKTNVVAVYNCGHVKVTRWLCPEYDSNARFYAHQFLERRGYKGPIITDATLFIETARRYNKPQSIAVRKQGKFYEVKIEHFN